MRKFDIDQEAKRSSTLGLAAGALVFLGLGGGLIFNGIYDICINHFSGIGFWIRLIAGLVFLFGGLPTVFVGAVCLVLFKRRRKLKRELKEMFKNDSHVSIGSPDAPGSMDSPPIILPREISYEYSPDFCRRVARRFISRHAKGPFIAAFILLAIGVIGLVAGGVGGFCWFCVFLSILVVLVWVRYYFAAIKISERMPDRRVRVSVAADSITFQTSEHLSTMKWSLIKKALVFPDILLLFTYGRTTYVAVPVASLGADLSKFVEDKVREHGGTVVFKGT